MVVNTAAVTAPAVDRGLISRRKVKAGSEGMRGWRGEYRMWWRRGMNVFNTHYMKFPKNC